MNSIILLVVIVAALLIGIGINSAVQQRERAAAEKRNRLALHRGHIRDAQEMLGLGATVPLDNSVRDVLLDYIGAHLSAIKMVDPGTPQAQEFQTWIDNQRQSAMPNVALQLPTATEQLTALRTQVQRLTEFIARMRNEPRIDGNKVLVAFQYMARLRLRCDVEGHVKIGQVAEQVHKQLGLAKQYYKYAYERLVKENISDTYVQEQLALLEKLMNDLRHAEEAALNGVAPGEQVEEPKEPELDPLFAPKKKW